MNGSNNLEESDAAPMHLGPLCLRKLQSSVGFDPLHRYRTLEKFYARHKFTEENAWVKQRIAEITGK